jgi:hypothetical protein
LFMGLIKCRTLTAGSHAPQQPLHVDCANGVGALKLQQLAPQLQQLGLQLQLYNAGQGRLNHDCGADYVQKEQSFPAGDYGLLGCIVLLLRYWTCYMLCCRLAFVMQGTGADGSDLVRPVTCI